MSLTALPRTGAGTWRHCRKACRAVSISWPYSFFEVARTLAMTSPVAGLTDSINAAELSSLLKGPIQVPGLTASRFSFSRMRCMI